MSHPNEPSAEPQRPFPQTPAGADPPTEPIATKTEPPGFWKKAGSGFVEHPLWTSVGAVVGIVGIVLSMIQIFVPPGSASEKAAGGATPEDLEVALVSIDGRQQITGTIVDAMGENPDQPTVVGATPVDVTLKNNGGQPSLISQVDAEVVFFEELHDCTMAGAGPALVTGLYSIKLPDNDMGSVERGSYTTDMRFEVKPGSVDRMVLTVGPERQSASSYPQVMAVRLTLVHDGSERLDVGAVAIVTTAENVDDQIARATDPKCAARNLEVLDQLYAIQSVKSADLERLREKYQTLR